MDITTPNLNEEHSETREVRKSGSKKAISSQV